MYRLLNRPIVSYGSLNTIQLNRLRPMIQNRLEYLKALQEIAGSVMNENHLFIRLCYHLSEYMNNKDVYGVVDDNLHEICSSLQITHENGFGKIHENVVYTEFTGIIATTFLDQFIDTPWKEIRPIRVIDHPFTNMELILAPIRPHELTKGKTSMVAIDIPLLSHMLKIWNIQNSQLDIDDQENLVGFMTKYVLPGMVNEYMDISVRNRLYYLTEDITIPFERKEDILVKGYEEVIKKPLKTILSAIRGSRQSYMKSLAEIPMIYSGGYLDSLPVTINSLNSYSYWIVFYTYVRWVHPVTFLSEGDYANKHNAATLLKKIDRLLSQPIYTKTMPEILLESTMVLYNDIKKKMT